ncbi:hypothetical protein LIER_22595 [Lithospermum erythrorhizon]|uniref:Hydroxyproline-rich glycoprotein family protein n=1 Tax=Lithospermum erythrorhizon TaxID=34254 RepID=A0AAV3QWR2_LITER
MRRSLANFPPLPATRTASFLSSFSTSSSGGGGDDGRGRGRGRGLPVDFSRLGGGVIPHDQVDQSQPPPQTSFSQGRGGGASTPPFVNSYPPSSGRGRGGVSPPPPCSGRGNVGVSSALPYSGNVQGRVPPPPPPSFGRGQGDASQPSFGRGRGGISHPVPPSQTSGFTPRSAIDSERLSSARPPLRKPMMFTKEELYEKPVLDAKLPSGILQVSSGAGRGTPIKRSPSGVDDSKPKQENRHIRKQVRGEGVRVDAAPKGPKLSRADAVKKAKMILSKGNDGRGRGRGGRGRGRGDRFEDDRDDDDDYEANEVQDTANQEMLATRLGPEMMNTVVEAFEDIADRVLPSPVDDAHVNALHTNLMIECEPEYMMGEFDQNPDIDEKPPMALRDFLEKVKPFVMSYEGIQSQEEWEEAMKETMETVPLMKEIVDYYSGPDRVTAKRQQEELERVAKTLPASAPSSVKRFTDRAVLSLQSNPGWGFDKKCQFMDKLVREASQQYK